MDTDTIAKGGVLAEMVDHSRLFSVVIVSYQNFNLWKQAVYSVLKQRYPCIQLIFYDDGTPGFSLENVICYIEEKRQDTLVSYVVKSHETNQGTVRTMRDAHDFCTGRYLMHLAADDALYDEEVLKSFADSLDSQNEKVMGVYARSVICNEDLSIMGEERCSFDIEKAMELNHQTAEDQWRALCESCCIHMGATAFARSKLMQFGDFDMSYRLLEDWPFFLAATESGYIFHYENFKALRYRMGGISDGNEFSQGRLLCFEDQLKIYEKKIIPNLNRLGLVKRFSVYRRYRNDRQDVAERGVLRSQETLSSLLKKQPVLYVFEICWMLSRWRVSFLVWGLGCAASVWMNSFLLAVVWTILELVIMFIISNKERGTQNDSQYTNH